MVKISTLELENVKRIKAVSLAPAENGLTVIGGDNGQGKTSVLDAIAWALGGEKFKPSNPQREGSVLPPHLRITLSNGLVVERKGDKGALKVTDPNGKKAGQQLLNEFVESLALNLPKFMGATGKEKAHTLLQIIGVEDKLAELERQEETIYNQRHALGQIADRKAKYAEELPNYTEAPAEEISIADLIKSQQEILARNGENQRKRADRERYDRELAQAQIDFDRAKKALEQAEQNALTARQSAEGLIDESTAEIEENIRNIDEINAKVRANIERERAFQEADELKGQYDELSEKIEQIRAEKASLLNNAEMPLAGLSVEDGELIYNGAKWDCMSGAEQLKIATAIVRRLNPECGFVLMDKLEQMDAKTLAEFGKWLEQEGLQVIATRVSTGDECSIIIEDGLAKTIQQPSQTWTKGVF
ncbi:MAG: AAA family ATPase [[Eubacterium] saphenum]|nr:AAA family ATPase [[Eubacterium] saphenum]